MTTAAVPALMTAEEYRLMPDLGKPTELVKGVPVDMPVPTPRHGEICARTAYLLQRFLDDHPMGRVVSNDSGVITERGPDTVRGPDVSFYSHERVPRGPMPLGYIDVVPELAIEVRSPSDRWPAVQRKLIEYLDAGVVLACALDEKTQTVHVFHAEQGTRIVAADSDLELPEVLPGFRVAVRRFFE
jgi:Uma2 family endonuclease